MAIVLTRVEPIGTRESTALVCGGGRSSMRAVSPVFPPDSEARGQRLRDIRVKLDLGLREAARCMHWSAANLSAIERGEMRLSYVDDGDGRVYDDDETVIGRIERACRVEAAVVRFRRTKREAASEGARVAEALDSAGMSGVGKA